MFGKLFGAGKPKPLNRKTLAKLICGPDIRLARRFYGARFVRCPRPSGAVGPGLRPIEAGRGLRRGRRPPLIGERQNARGFRSHVD